MRSLTPNIPFMFPTGSIEVNEQEFSKINDHALWPVGILIALFFGPRDNSKKHVV